MEEKRYRERCLHQQPTEKILNKVNGGGGGGGGSNAARYANSGRKPVRGTKIDS